MNWDGGLDDGVVAGVYIGMNLLKYNDAFNELYPPRLIVYI